MIHISESETARDFMGVMTRVRAGVETFIESRKRPVTVLHPCEPVRRTISECIALLAKDSKAFIDPVSSKDLKAAAQSRRAKFLSPNT